MSLLMEFLSADTPDELRALKSTVEGDRYILSKLKDLLAWAHCTPGQVFDAEYGLLSTDTSAYTDLWAHLTQRTMGAAST